MRVVVCGAGVAGLALSWWLERAGHEVLLVERAPGPHGAGYLVDCQGPGYDAAESMDLLPQLEDRAAGLSELVYHHADGSVRERFVEEDANRGRIVSLMRGDLESVLHGALGPAANVRFGTSVDAVVERHNRIHVTLSDGSAEQADLLVGADGVHSRVRALVFGPERRFLRDLGIRTAAYVFEDPRTARQLGDALHMLDPPGLQVGAYPIGTGEVATLFSYRVATGAPPPRDPRAELRQVFGSAGWIAPQLLAHCPDPPQLYYDRIAHVEMPVWSQNRVVLVGDACHAMSLLTGHGAGTALAGAQILAEELTRGGPCRGALERYEDRLRPTVSRLQAEGAAASEDFLPC